MQLLRFSRFVTFSFTYLHLGGGSLIIRELGLKELRIVY